MKFAIRRANSQDIIVLESIKLMHQEVFGYAWGEITDLDKSMYHWIAWHGNEPAAFAVLAKSARFQDMGYLSRAGVLERFRGYGLQKRLIKARIKAAQQFGWQWLVTDTLSDAPHSMANLIDCGFRPYQPSAPWARSDSVYWIKNISQRKLK